VPIGPDTEGGGTINNKQRMKHNRRLLNILLNILFAKTFPFVPFHAFVHVLIAPPHAASHASTSLLPSVYHGLAFPFLSSVVPHAKNRKFRILEQKFYSQSEGHKRTTQMK